MTYQEDLQDRQKQRMELIRQLQIERNSQIFILWNGDALDRKDFLVLSELERMRESGKQYAETLLRGGMMLEAQKARNIADQLSDHYKYHGHPIDAFEARDDLGLSVRYCEGEEWQKIRALGDRYDSLVEQEGLILNAVISTAIETANLTYQRLRSSQPTPKITQLVEELYAKDISSGQRKAQPKILNLINTEGKSEVIINNHSSS